MLLLCEYERYELENHTQGTSGGTLNICRWNFEKNQFLLIFDDFGKIGHLGKNTLIYEGHFWYPRAVGNRQTSIFFSKMYSPASLDVF